MGKKQRLKDEIANLQTTLYQERQDHASYIARFKRMAAEQSHVQSVIRLLPDGSYEQCQIHAIEPADMGGRRIVII